MHALTSLASCCNLHHLIYMNTCSLLLICHHSQWGYCLINLIFFPSFFLSPFFPHPPCVSHSLLFVHVAVCYVSSTAAAEREGGHSRTHQTTPNRDCSAQQKRYQHWSDGEKTPYRPTQVGEAGMEWYGGD